MKRNLSSLVLASSSLATLLGACVGEIGTDSGAGGNGGSNLAASAQAAAKAEFMDGAFPKMATCVGCHAAQLPFLKAAAAEAYAAIKEYDEKTSTGLLDYEDPTKSNLIKIEHSTSSLNPNQATKDAILAWLNKEKAAIEAAKAGDSGTGGGGASAFETALITPQLCTATAPCPLNEISLDALGSAGSKITFNYQQTTDKLSLASEITLVAGPQGLFIEHPLFVGIKTGSAPAPDSRDGLADLKENLKAGETKVIPTADRYFDFPAGTQLKLVFGKKESVRTYQADKSATPPDGGCKNVQSFLTNVKPQLAPCVGCHGNAGNGGASGAMNIVGLNDNNDVAARKMNCDQVKTRVNFADIPNSGVFRAADPAVATHANRKAANIATFRAEITKWIDVEK